MHGEVLAGGTASVADVLSHWPAMQSFYLPGGTALALHLGHRRSRDLGFFTRQPLSTLPMLPGLDDMLGQLRHDEQDIHPTE